jgi:hypothetical protein
VIGTCIAHIHSEKALGDGAFGERPDLNFNAALEYPQSQFSERNSNWRRSGKGAPRSFQFGTC